MASPTATPPGALEETDGDITYVRTDPELPPVAIIDRSPITTRHKIVFGVISLLGAVAWAIVAFVRGETVNAVWFVIAAICTYVIAFRFYARLIEMKIVRPRDDQATPAEVFDNATDYMPTDRRVLFGHHFAAIAGAGPLVGPVLAMQMGYLPGAIWIIIGAVFAGCVQDYLVLWVSTHRRGRSLGQMVRDEIGAVGGAAAIVAVIAIMIILLAVLALVVVQALAQSPWGVFSIAMTIPIAIFMGAYLRFLRPGRVSEVSLIGVVLLLLAVISGNWVAQTSWGQSWFGLSQVALSWCIIIYGFAASVLPVWFLLAPRDYLSTFMKVGTIALLAVGILIARPVIQAPAVSAFAHSGTGPVFAGSLFPFLFITIACGALSGFHSLISSGTTPKMLEKQSQMRLIGYGGMLTESFVGIMALVTAAILNQHLYFVLNAPAGKTGGTAESAAAYVNSLPLGADPVRAEQIKQAAADVGEKTIVSRTGGAPTLAIGMSQVLHRAFGGPALQAFWYHFAIMFEALFILTTVDAGTRVARFMVSDGLGNLGGPLRKFRNPSWRPGAWLCSLIVVAAWGSMLLMGVTDPLGGINTLFPLFGIANQLLAAIALTLVAVVI
ncbi:MAG: carbon starvation protein A, partial [Mycobacteriaceae bacterium]|nr:carbon starvation protein A [Mycobacteriaceae bacterium]